ncbi:MAG: hypothetical protein JSS87_03575 [Acidobacteria bacterium]|nr:hypothetical protein [Acidobacteriota bacterium]
MKKVVLSSLLAASVSVLATAQTAVNINNGAQQQQNGGSVQLSQPEYNAYTNATSQTDPKAKAAALEAFLQQYPQSAVKTAVLEQLMGAYQQFDAAKTLTTADKVLQVDPNNIRALALEAGLRKAQGDQATDQAQKSADYGQAASFAERALKATKPADMSQADFDTIKKQATPYLYSAIGIDALTRKDMPAAISAYEAELKSVDPETTKQPAPYLQDTYFLAQAYYGSTPPDYLKCSFYATRTATYAPDQFKATFQPLASYCYKKFHGSDEGYDAMKTAAAANVFYPADLVVKPAPTPADFVNQLLANPTTDLATLALSDREFVITNGTPAQADQVFAPVKGKEVKVPGVVVSVTDTDVMLAVSEDAKQANPKIADFDFKLKEPLKTVPAVGDAIDMIGTFDSYTQKPLMINMINAEAAVKAPAKAPAKKAPAHHAPARRKR